MLANQLGYIAQVTKYIILLLEWKGNVLRNCKSVWLFSQAKGGGKYYTTVQHLAILPPIRLMID